MAEEKIEESVHNISVKSNKCIVLDIDGTLIDTLSKQIYDENENYIREPDYVTNEDDYIFKRPGLDLFIKFCFANFKHVSIWTAASKEWADVFINNIIKPEYRNKFVETNNFVWSKDRLSKRFRMNYYSQYNNAICFRKPLSKIWRSKSRKKDGWNKQNTLIIEDTPSNCVDNYGNAIYVETYEIIDDIQNNDKCLFYLMAYLSVLLRVENVRFIEKRYWNEIIEFINKINDIDDDLQFSEYVLRQFIGHDVSCLEEIQAVGKSEKNLKEIGINENK